MHAHPTALRRSIGTRATRNTSQARTDGAMVEAIWANGPRYRRNKKNAAGTWLMVGRDDSGTTWTVAIKWSDEDERVLRAITGWRNDE